MLELENLLRLKELNKEKVQQSWKLSQERSSKFKVGNYGEIVALAT